MPDKHKLVLVKRDQTSMTDFGNAVLMFDLLHRGKGAEFRAMTDMDASFDGENADVLKELGTIFKREAGKIQVDVLVNGVVVDAPELNAEMK